MPTFVVSHSTSSGTNTQALFSAYSTCWCVLKTACACADTQRDTIGYIGTKQEALTRGGVRVTTSTFARAHTLASASLRASCRERPAGTSFYCQHLHSEKQGKRARGDEKCNGRRKRLGSGEQHGSEERKKMAGKQIMACAESLPHLPLVPSCCRKTLTEEGDVCQNSAEWMVNESSYDVYIHLHLTFQEQAL